MKTEDLLKQEVKNYSALFEIPEELILAIIQTESAGSLYAYRTEAHYRYLFNIKQHAPFRSLKSSEKNNEVAPKDFPYLRNISSRNTEWIGQQASWGPMQVMGAVAREYGFSGPFPELCSAQGIFYGCRHLLSLKKVWYDRYGWKGVAAAYNAGSVRFSSECELVNQHYVDTVARNGAAELFTQPLVKNEEAVV
ncbi:transglycosylase SLT domain-containing protein [Endozoicomonas gorgoniicola]|uniref:Transglycosylase SLT domain-containing protein n=1 Tax=Endozoicomonas gorgoniicola TaxID=1234144 RepID=A0ABT3N2H5_9GAMM|nr:transglycosylase SLT domain-containing protein [Endozoicomonas gorgoniicola]MCW7555538.1 transglycosylase SLT domain-containing protein [Endozoicomonas gorgoniicola]